MHTLSRLTQEMAIVLIGAAAMAEAGQLDGMDPRDVISLWCVVGGCMGAFCSLHFFRVKQGPDANADMAWQFGVNMVLSIAFSPLLVPSVAYWTGLPLGMHTAIPTALTLGLLAQRLVARYLPLLQRVLDAKAARTAAELGVDTQAAAKLANDLGVKDPSKPESDQ